MLDASRFSAGVGHWADCGRSAYSKVSVERRHSVSDPLVVIWISALRWSLGTQKDGAYGLI